MPSSKLGECLIKIICSRILTEYEILDRSKLYYKKLSTCKVFEKNNSNIKDKLLVRFEVKVNLSWQMSIQQYSSLKLSL